MLPATNAWLGVLKLIMGASQLSSPRGMKTKEWLGFNCQVDMTRPVVEVAARKLSYRFMAAEAMWILSGSDLVSGIEPYNKKIASYSDDGYVFFGAYGPPFAQQFEYVRDTLIADTDTRQATMVFWRINPPPAMSSVSIDTPVCR